MECKSEFDKIQEDLESKGKKIDLSELEEKESEEKKDLVSLLKTELQENQWVCKSCGKHHRISCENRFDLFFGTKNYTFTRREEQGKGKKGKQPPTS